MHQLLATVRYPHVRFQVRHRSIYGLRHRRASPTRQVMRFVSLGTDTFWVRPGAFLCPMLCPVLSTPPRHREIAQDCRRSLGSSRTGSLGDAEAALGLAQGRCRELCPSGDLLRKSAEIQVTTFGIDLAKYIFRIHDVDALGRVTDRHRFRLSELRRLFVRSSCSHQVTQRASWISCYGRVWRN